MLCVRTSHLEKFAVYTYYIIFLIMVKYRTDICDITHIKYKGFDKMDKINLIYQIY